MLPDDALDAGAARKEAYEEAAWSPPQVYTKLLYLPRVRGQADARE